MSIPNHWFQTGRFQILTPMSKQKKNATTDQLLWLPIIAKFASMTRFDHADLKEAAYKMIKELDDQDIESVIDETIDSTLLKAQAHTSPGSASVQH